MRKLTATGMDNVTGQFNIMNKDDVLMIGALVGNSDTPTITMGSPTVIGTNASYSIVGNNSAGKITVNSGTGVSLATGKILTLNFANSLSYPNGSIITFSAGNDNFAFIYTRLYAVGAVDKIDLYIASLALSASTSYVGYYKVMGY